MKQLQIALDLFDEQSVMDILEEVAEYVDIIELGTPVIVAEGKELVTKVKERYPDKIVFADIKVMDGGGVVPAIVYDAGADMASVMAAADDSTIRSAVACAREKGKKILVDMCSVHNMEERAAQIDEIGPDYICVHVGYDTQGTGTDPIEELKKISEVKSMKAAAGGIHLGTFEAACKSPADVIIVGGGIHQQENPREIAREMYTILEKYR